MTDAAAAPDAGDQPLGDPHDREIMRADVLEGLGMSQKELSPKYFYDAVGSELFERITALEEYYPTRTERALLERWMPVWVDELGPEALVELGAGSAAKSRVILDAMEDTGHGNLYVPVDVSGDFLHETARRLRAEYTDLEVRPEVADITEPLDLGYPLPEPAWFALLGSTIGNFDREHAIRLLCRTARHMRSGDAFLMGADLRPSAKKPKAVLDAAYNDAAGVTAAFNLNILSVLNRELGADFDPQAFEHEAFYSEEHGRIEMHLRAESRQSVRIPGADPIVIRAGETIRTEISCKYDRDSIDDLFAESGLAIDRWVQDESDLFALVLGRRKDAAELG